LTIIFSGGFQPSFAKGALSRVVYGAVICDEFIKGVLTSLSFWLKPNEKHVKTRSYFSILIVRAVNGRGYLPRNAESPVQTGSGKVSTN